MTFSTLKTHLKLLPCGKKLNYSVYTGIHTSCTPASDKTLAVIGDLMDVSVEIYTLIVESNGSSRVYSLVTPSPFILNE